LGFKNSNTSKVQSSKADKFRRSNFEIFVPIFLENGERWSTFLTSFESTREALHPKILWAKVQKQRSFGRSNSELYPNFLGIDELCSTFILFIYLFISALTLTTPATQIKTTKCQPRIERLQKEH